MTVREVIADGIEYFAGRLESLNKRGDLCLPFYENRFEHGLTIDEEDNSEEQLIIYLLVEILEVDFSLFICIYTYTYILDSSLFLYIHTYY